MKHKKNFYFAKLQQPYTFGEIYRGHKLQITNTIASIITSIFGIHGITITSGVLKFVDF